MTAADTPDAARWALVCKVLDAVLDAPPQQRAAVLETHCAGDMTLRTEVESLITAQSEFNTRLETPVVERAGALVEGDELAIIPDRTSGETIGPWRLVRELGRGGMGSVWLAERADGGFEQRVALKLLKRGLDSDAILERFLAERQILARLQHPNIAHLVDGGLTTEGRPYFAMELVEGEPVTRWCDQRRLPVADRVDLFVTIAEAVQHAHQQLVVHRDLKPSNILVTAQGEVKLLDFGIAKLLDAEAARAEAQTLTQLGIRMLTPEYAAPEQLRGESVTTSTDVYALGVLLYELLAGKRPPAASADVQSRLPPRPSTQIDQAAAQACSTTLERLRRSLRGDLDTIALRALHPDPQRRYPTAEALAADLRRHRNRQPVLARPDSLRYRAGRFISRNRLAIAAAAVVALTLVGGIVATAWQAREARQQAARAEQVKEFLTQLFQASSPQEWRGKQTTARDLLDAGAKRVDDELAVDPALHAEMLAVIGSLYVDQAQYDHAENLLKRSLDERRHLFGENHEDYADSLQRWAALSMHKGNWKVAEQAATQSIEIFQRKFGNDLRTAGAIRSMSLIRMNTGEIDDAIRLWRQSLAIRRQVHGSKHADVASDLRLLGSMLVDQGRYTEAESLFKESLAIDRELYGEKSTRYALGLNAQARLFQRKGLVAQSAQSYQQAASIHRQANDLVGLQDALNHYGSVLCDMGLLANAERNLRESLSLAKKIPLARREIGIRAVSVADCLTKAGRPAEAIPLLRQGLADIKREVGETHIYTSFALSRLTETLFEQGQLVQATQAIDQAINFFKQSYGVEHALTLDSERIKSNLQFASGDRRQALLKANRILERLQSKSTTADPTTIKTTLDVSRMELQLGQARDAELRLRKIKPILEASGYGPYALTATMLQGAALAELGQVKAGERLLSAALSGRSRMYGDSSIKTAEAEIYFGLYSSKDGDRALAQKLLRSGQGKFARQGSDEAEIMRHVRRDMAHRD